MQRNNAHKAVEDGKGIVLFDGYCILCTWSVLFILKRDKKDYFRFSSLQSEKGKELLDQIRLSENFGQSVILIEGNTVYFKSGAALRIAKKLRGFWPILYILIIIPKTIRDTAYDFIAKRRFKWFGKRDRCYLPKKDLSYKFIL